MRSGEAMASRSSCVNFGSTDERVSTLERAQRRESTSMRVRSAAAAQLCYCVHERR